MSVTREIDDHLASLAPEGPLLERAATEARAKGLPVVGRTVGRFLEAVVLAAGARRVLEIGTANGYATLWLARSLPDDGGLFSIEIDPHRAAMARAHLEAAGLGDRAHVIVGDPARMVHKVAGPFDVIFNAGDRRQYGPLLDRLAALLRPGGMLVTGNVLQDAEAAAGLAGPAEPAGGGRGRPAGGGQGDRPADEGNRPADEGNRPADEGNRPANRTDRPADEGNRPADKADRPADKADRPANRTDKADRPANRADRPADKADRPADKADRPADKADAVAAYNRRLAGDRRFVTSFLPVGDGLALSVKLR